MVAKIGTNADCISCWPNFYPMQVAFYLAREITQDLDAIPWVRCASGNVWRSKLKFPKNTTQICNAMSVTFNVFVEKDVEVHKKY